MAVRAAHLSILSVAATVDRLYAIAVLSAAASADGLQVDVLLDGGTVLAARRPSTSYLLPVSPDYASAGTVAFDRAEDTLRDLLGVGVLPSWTALLAWAAKNGAVRVRASADMLHLLGLTLAELDGVVEGVDDVGQFLEEAGDGALLVV
jgi:peroxiredoxin family protein